MDDVNVDAKEVFRRVEVLTGPVRRRRWSAEEKARIVEESLIPGARVSDVARRWQICSQQVFSWRREARGTVMTTPCLAADPSMPGFVPIMAEAEASPPITAPTASSSSAVIEVKLAGAIVRVASGMDGAMLTEVLRAVRASATRT
jgi:transposase